MELLTRTAVRNGVLGGVVGTLLGYIPLVMLVAPLAGGGLAGFLERDGPKRGAIAGAVAGIVMVVLGTAITAIMLLARFGELPLRGLEGGIGSLGIAAVLSLLAGLGGVLVASIGGALGGILVEAGARDRLEKQAEQATHGSGGRTRLAVIVLGCLLAGAVTFVLVALATTAALNPFIWPSALVGLPIGFIAGSVVAVLCYAYLVRRPDNGRNWRRIGGSALAIGLVFSVVVGGLFVLGDDRIEGTTESTYSYEVAIAANQTIQNATFYVPVPVVDGTSELGELFVSDGQYHRSSPVVRGYEPDPEPVEFTYELVETEHGLMLAISTDRIQVTQVYYRTVENETMGWHERIAPDEYDPTDPTMGVQDDGSFTFAVSLATNRSIETADPFGAEPLFTTPDLREIECRQRAAEMERCFEYDSHGYASYETDTDTAVYIRAGFEGRNEWFSGGWSGNEFLQWASIELVGPQSEWYQTTGTLDIGRGNYR